jgi:hypothetical protein
MNKDKTQNFEPIYNGGSPTFFKAIDGSLYVSEGKALLHIPL